MLSACQLTPLNKWQRSSRPIFEHPSEAWSDMFYPTNLASSQYIIIWVADFQRNRTPRCLPDTAAVICVAFWARLTKPDFPTTEAQHAAAEHCIRNGLCSLGHNHYCKDHVKLVRNFIIPYSIFWHLLGNLQAALFFFYFFSPAPQLVQSIYFKRIFPFFHSWDVLNETELKMLW